MSKIHLLRDMLFDEMLSMPKGLICWKNRKIEAIGFSGEEVSEPSFCLRRAPVNQLISGHFFLIKREAGLICPCLSCALEAVKQWPLNFTRYESFSGESKILCGEVGGYTVQKSVRLRSPRLGAESRRQQRCANKWYEVCVNGLMDPRHAKSSVLRGQCRVSVRRDSFYACICIGVSLFGIMCMLV